MAYTSNPQLDQVYLLAAIWAEVRSLVLHPTHHLLLPSRHFCMVCSTPSPTLERFTHAAQASTSVCSSWGC